jgi:hypothetical protein
MAKAKTTEGAGAGEASPAAARHVLRISALPAQGFWRCGVHHPKGPVDHPLDRFTREEVERMRAEPMLKMELVELPNEPGPSAA